MTGICSGEPAHDRCHFKVKLMLAMTDKILQWLRDNEVQLQDIDYVDGVDYCTRLAARVSTPTHVTK